MRCYEPGVPHISLVFREMWGATVGRPSPVFREMGVDRRSPLYTLGGYQSQSSPHLSKTTPGLY